MRPRRSSARPRRLAGACGNKEDDLRRRGRAPRALPRRRRPRVPGADLAPAQPDRPRGPGLPGGLPPGAADARARRDVVRASSSASRTTRATRRTRPPATSRSATRRATSTARSPLGRRQRLRLPRRRRCRPTSRSARAATAAGLERPDPGRRCCCSRSRTTTSRTARSSSRSRNPAGRAAGATSATSTSSARVLAALRERGSRTYRADRRRGRRRRRRLRRAARRPRPAGARARRREGGEPGVGVRRVGRRRSAGRPRGRAGRRRSGRAALRRAQLGGAGLAGDRARRGSPRRCRCPSRTTARIRRCDRPGGRGGDRRRGAAGAARRARRRGVRRGRRPREPIVAATSPSAARVACTRPWPIAVEPTARSSPISPAAGIVLVAAPGDAGRLVEAEALAPSPTSRRAPELRRRAARRPSCRSRRRRARACRRTTRRWRSASSTPSSVASVCDGIGRRGARRPAPRARAVSVTILNVEPGGCRPENAMPASGEDLAGARAAAPTTPPSRPASAVDRGAAGRCGDDRRAHRGRARRGAGWPARAPPASSAPPGVAAQRGRRRRARARSVPTWRVGGHAVGRAARGARSGGIGPELRRRSTLADAGAGGASAPAPSASDRAVAREQRRARRAGGRAALQLLARAQPGERRASVRPGDPRRSPSVPRPATRSAPRDRAEHARARRARARVDDAVASGAPARRVRTDRRGGRVGGASR